MFEVSTGIEIEASAETVWQLLTDLDHFHEWNPFIREARGTPVEGAMVQLVVEPSFGPHLPFRAHVLASEQNHVLRWRGQVLAAWLACGDHAFMIEPFSRDSVRLVQSEIFTGLLPRLTRRLVEREALRGFRAMNRALKIRAERASSVAPVARAAS